MSDIPSQINLRPVPPFPFMSSSSAPSPSSAMPDLLSQIALRPPPPFPFTPCSSTMPDLLSQIQLCPSPPPQNLLHSPPPPPTMLASLSSQSKLPPLPLTSTHPPPLPFMSSAPYLASQFQLSPLPPLPVMSSAPCLASQILFHPPLPPQILFHPPQPHPTMLGLSSQSKLCPLPPTHTQILSRPPSHPPSFTSRSSSWAPCRSSTVPGLPSQRGRSPEILLDQNCFIGYCENSNSAKTESSQGLSVEVSFKICDPPALSQCFVRCYDLTGSQRLAGEPDIVAAAGGLALLAISFSDDGIHPPCTDYFIYRAGPGIPSLNLLPRPYPTDRCRLNMVAVLPICDDSEYYAVVFPVLELFVLESRNQYTLHIYRSDKKAWCTQVALVAKDTETQNAKIKLLLHDATSVVYAGTGLIGWVDLWWGVLICNVLDQKPTIQFVPVPVPEPCTPAEFHMKYEDLDPRPYRHLAINNGRIKFIELKFHRDAAFNVKRRDDQGWMATTWTRSIFSDVWHEGLTFDTSDISIIDLSFMHLLPEFLNEKKKLAWEKFISGVPTLSLHDDIVYIMVKMSLWHPTGLILTVNTRSLTLESCAQCCGERMAFLEPTYVPSVLSSYLGLDRSPPPMSQPTTPSTITCRPPLGDTPVLLPTKRPQKPLRGLATDDLPTTGTPRLSFRPGCISPSKRPPKPLHKATPQSHSG